MQTLKSFSELPAIPPPPKLLPARKAAERLGASTRRMFSDSDPPRRRELIVGGDIKWKPVDLNAAKLLMRSPEIHKPQPTPPMNNKIGERPRAQEHAEKSVPDAAICQSVKNHAATMETNAVTLANDAASAKRLMETIAASLRTDVLEFEEELPKAIRAIRQWRMTINQEKELSLKALQELRQFFLGSDHEREMSRLENFIRMCERLRSLTSDGTLAKVADVMLTLA